MSGFRSYTMTEISRFLEVTKQTVAKRAKKENWPYEEGKNKNGFVFSRLPDHIKAAIIASRNQGALPCLYEGGSESPITTKDVVPHTNSSVHEAPSEVDPSFQQWQSKPESCREEAMKRLAVVKKARSIRARHKRGKTRALERYAKSQGISRATLQRYISAADKALQSARKNGTETLMAQILALTPNYGKSKGVYRAFSPEAIHYALALFAGQEYLNLSDVYKHTLNEGYIQGWKVGSYDAFRDILDRKLDNSLKVLARRGMKKYEAECELKILRDYKEIWPNFMWCGDHHIFDVFVKAPGGKVLRPWVTAWMDMASRSIMGWCVSFRPNSDTVALALAHAISKKENSDFPQHGLPWSVYIDNGKDYRSKYLTGEEIKIGKIDYPAIIERFAALGIDPYYIDLEYDPGQRAWVKQRGKLKHVVRSVQVGGVYARLNIHQRYATVYHPWAKPLERAFRSVVQSFSRKLPGWCGSGHDQRPEKLTWEIRRGLLLDFEEFCSRWYGWVVYQYNKSPRTGHGMEGRSPDEAFLSCGPPKEVDEKLLTFALLRKDQVKVHNWGFKLIGREFELDLPSDLSGARILNKLINRYITVFYDPDFKMTQVYLDGQYVCDGKPLRRASFIRPDDPVMQEKLKLQAYQRKLNKLSLQRLKAEAPQEIGYREDTLLALTTGRTGPEDEDSSAGNESCRLTAKGHEIIPLTEEEKYRMILHKLAAGEELSENLQQWRKEYETTEDYRRRKQLYDAELDYMKHQLQRSAT